jgi:hypothetical protein
MMVGTCSHCTCLHPWTQRQQIVRCTGDIPDKSTRFVVCSELHRPALSMGATGDSLLTFAEALLRVHAGGPTCSSSKSQGRKQQKNIIWYAFRVLVDQRVAHVGSRPESRQVTAPNGLTVSCGVMPSPPSDAAAFKHQMAASVDPVPRPVDTDVVSQLITMYSQLLRSSKLGGTGARAHAVDVTGASPAPTNVEAAATGGNSQYQRRGGRMHGETPFPACQYPPSDFVLFMDAIH